MRRAVVVPAFIRICGGGAEAPDNLRLLRANWDRDWIDWIGNFESRGCNINGEVRYVDVMDWEGRELVA